MRKAVVSVATGTYYQKCLARLERALFDMDKSIMPCFVTEPPTNWPTQQEIPYAFKAYALEAASKIADMVLWCDSVVMPIQDMEPLWNKIDRVGAWIPLNGWTNYDWTADSAYPDLFPGKDIELARSINKTVPHCVATCFGLNLKSDDGKKILDEYFRLASTTTAFCGPWSNTNNPNAWKYDPSMMGPCGPPDVLGHRHDQTCLSVIAWRQRIRLTQCPEFYGLPGGISDKTIIVGNGGPID